ncbi:MAG: SGNH/GDSL hydrolase family protein [Clostridia bacterium]|nr:SGNH/GDSL hydrolase family protein [Clostridia bacterium]
MSLKKPKGVLRVVCLIVAAVLLSAFAVGCKGGNENSSQSSNGGVDVSKYPNYVDPNEATYAFNEKEMITPYWQGNVIYNETVLLLDEGGQISGKLEYVPVKVLSVRDFKYDVEFTEGVDYTVEGNVIKRTEGSSIPYLTKENLNGENVPEPYKKVSTISNVLTDFVMMGTNVMYTEGPLLYGNQIAVSYVYDLNDLNKGALPAFSEATLPKVRAKLSGGESVNIVITGDSVAEGCSSSSKFNRPPYMPNFIDMAVGGLKTAYPAASITLSNQAKGGMTSDWGAAGVQTEKIIAAKPDVVYIHFGINDCGSGFGAGKYVDNIQSIILTVQAALPDCEFVVFKAFTPNTWAYDMENFESYWTRLDKAVQSMKNVYTLDMYTLSKEMLKVKKYSDVTGNGINHLNDFTARLYTMGILEQLIEY